MMNVPKTRERIRPNRAFTLLELLVVISIISIMMAILLPSLSRVRQQAKETQCRNNLRSMMFSQTTYINEYERFPDLNNDEDDGAWQYNYLIYDGRDFDANFGPLVSDEKYLDDIQVLYCPVQMDPYNSLATPQNPWPVVSLLDTRAGYSRRFHLSGKSLSDFQGNPAVFADALHLPKVVQSGHVTGVNAVYLDGHVRWVKDQELLTKNDLGRPFSRDDNSVMEDIWDFLNRGR
ncbi:MAG: prepilin-type N-terminal cleavage/methylation domain-containing protein [Planctomycetota bacterium]